MGENPEQFTKAAEDFANTAKGIESTLSGLRENLMAAIPGAIVLERKQATIEEHPVTITRSGNGHVTIDFKDKELEKEFYDSLK